MFSYKRARGMVKFLVNGVADSAMQGNNQPNKSAQRQNARGQEIVRCSWMGCDRQ